MKSKVCSKCGELKYLNQFSRCKSHKDGLGYKCKICSSKRGLEYRRTKDGVVTKIYSHQVEYSKLREHNPPAYTKGELKDWMFSQEIFHEIYDNWVSSGYLKGLKPSCDRTDDYQGYNLDRLQLMTWNDNNKKGCEDRKNGVNNKQSKSIISTHKITGKEMEYYSIRHAERETSINNANISKCCLGKGNYKSAGGYYWRFKTR